MKFRSMLLLTTLAAAPSSSCVPDYQQLDSSPSCETAGVTARNPYDYDWSLSIASSDPAGVRIAVVEEGDSVGEPAAEYEGPLAVITGTTSRDLVSSRTLKLVTSTPTARSCPLRLVGGEVVTARNQNTSLIVTGEELGAECDWLASAEFEVDASLDLVRLRGYFGARALGDSRDIEPAGTCDSIRAADAYDYQMTIDRAVLDVDNILETPGLGPDPLLTVEYGGNTVADADPDFYTDDNLDSDTADYGSYEQPFNFTIGGDGITEALGFPPLQLEHLLGDGADNEVWIQIDEGYPSAYEYARCKLTLSEARVLESLNRQGRSDRSNLVPMWLFLDTTNDLDCENVQGLKLDRGEGEEEGEDYDGGVIIVHLDATLKDDITVPEQIDPPEGWTGTTSGEPELCTEEPPEAVCHSRTRAGVYYPCNAEYIYDGPILIDDWSEFCEQEEPTFAGQTDYCECAYASASTGPAVTCVPNQATCCVATPPACCSAGFDQADCPSADPCEGNTCRSAGDLTAGCDAHTSGDGYDCDCSNDFLFDEDNLTCVADPCEDHTCASEGDTAADCVPDNDFEDYSCDCSDDFDYDEDEQVCVPDPCADNTCASGGDATATCVPDADGDGYSCNCNGNYDDVDGTCVLNPCAGEPCDNGTCVPTGESYTCDCDQGYSPEGNTCVDTDGCANDPCEGGECFDVLAADGGGFRCECTEGQEGETCAEIDGCADNPCFEGVSCTDAVAPETGYQCGACPQGYVGDGKSCEPKPNLGGDTGGEKDDSDVPEMPQGPPPISSCACNGSDAPSSRGTALLLLGVLALVWRRRRRWQVIGDQ